jgi:hypothetical protein
MRRSIVVRRVVPSADPEEAAGRRRIKVNAYVKRIPFLPCFLFIFLGAPHLEKLGQRLRLRAAFTASTAAVALG